MSDIVGFFAYPSSPADLAETIENSIASLNKNSGIRILSWKDANVTGKYIINEILDKIDSCDIFLCDITSSNFNVLFELGYAIAKNKPVSIVFNKSISTAKRDFEKLQILSTIGYASYENHQDIVDSFLSVVSGDQKLKTLSDEMYQMAPTKKSLLYLKSSVASDASMQLSISIKECSLPNVEDDPTEVLTQPFEWYIRQLASSYGVVVHFLSDEHIDSAILNAKHSLISGLAVGFGLDVLMLAHSPFTSPIDYRDILKVHGTSNQCHQYTLEWLKNIEAQYQEDQATFHSHLRDQKALDQLNSLFIGEPIAEHEADELSGYFLETREYFEALNSQQSLFIGRKGTGKTANLYKIATTLKQDKRNFVCIIQPVSHEITGVMNMLQQNIARSEQSYLVESVWKYLIHTELAKSVYKELISRPPYIQPTNDEGEFISFVQQHEKLINADFTLRLENAVNSLCGLSEYKSVESQRIKISEILHDNVIVQLRALLGNVLNTKNKVTILIDNLDAAWNKNDLKELSHFLLGLLAIAKNLVDEFHGNDYRTKEVNLSLIIFLRSDIFTQVLSYANERDKLQHSRLIWEDIDMLFRVVENRFVYSAESIPSPAELWGRFFCKAVNGMPLREYVEQLILPRPRDIIYLFRAAIQEAANRGHTMVTESDFIAAELKYSQYALESLLAENGNRVSDLEELLYEFAGAPEIIDYDEVLATIGKISLTNFTEVIDLLCELTFLGLETAPDKFEYMNEMRSKRILQRLAERTVQSSSSKIQRFKIHNAFHAYLGVTQTAASYS